MTALDPGQPTTPGGRPTKRPQRQISPATPFSSTSHPSHLSRPLAPLMPLVAVGGSTILRVLPIRMHAVPKGEEIRPHVIYRLPSTRGSIRASGRWRSWLSPDHATEGFLARPLGYHYVSVIRQTSQAFLRLPACRAPGIGGGREKKRPCVRSGAVVILALT